MTGRPPLFILAGSTCAICERGRLSVPVLVELRPGRLLCCSECASEAVVALVRHYGDAGAADVLAPVEPDPISA